MTRACPNCSAEAPREASRFCAACGTPLPEPARHPVRRWRGRLPAGLLATRRRRLLALGAAGAAVLLAVAAVRTPQILASDPAAPVEQAVAALEDADAPAVLAVIGLEADTFESFDLATKTADGLLGADALDQGYTPPDVRMGEPQEPRTTLRDDHGRPAGTARSIPLTYTYADGGHEETAAEVVRGRTGWTRPWNLTGKGRYALIGTIELDYRPAGDLTIGGVTYGESESIMPPGSADALVGTYQVTLDHPLFEADAGTIEVRPGATTLLDPQPKAVTDEVVAEVTDQIHRHVEECAAESTELRPVGCPMRHDPGHFLPLRGDAQWELQEMPEFTLVPAEDLGELGAPITVETTDPGSATVTYTYADGTDGEQEVDVVVGGTVDLDEDGAPAWHR